MPLNKNQEDLYNLYLSTYKRQQNKPFTRRKNFENFEQEHPEEYVSILKLDKLFNMYGHINRQLYLQAPYKIYPDTDFFDLKFYNTLPAMKCYNLYIKEISEQSPDSLSQLQFIKESLLFIRDFCVENNITIDEYLRFRKVLTLSWAVHIIEYKVSLYVIMGFGYYGKFIWDLLHEMPEDEQELLVSDLIKNYKTYKKRLEQSKLAKKLIIEGIKGISIFIKEELANKKEVC